MLGYMLKINFTPNVTGWILENIDHESIAVETCVPGKDLFSASYVSLQEDELPVDFCIW